MARPKKKNETKSYVRLRTKKRAGGAQSLYLDFYKDGKRKYEYLTDANGNPMRLLPETGDPVTAAIIQEHNANVWAKAQTIQAERNQIVVAQQAIDGIGDKRKKYDKMLLSELYKIYADYSEKKNYVRGKGRLVGMGTRLQEYKPNAMIKDVDKDFICGFADFLKTSKSKRGGTLAKSTVAGYFTMFAMMIKFAVKQDFIIRNPLTKVDSKDRPEPGESTREYLTIDEVKALMNTPCKNEKIKSAFLFSCFCGLRISDVERLTWGNLMHDGEEVKARIIVKKTRRQLELPLSATALAFMPERGDAKDCDQVFTLPTLATIDLALHRWAKAAGIKKCVTFHVARHTFATMGLKAGQDIATVSELLGHKSIKTTQIYAKVVGENKTKAVNAIGALFD